MSDVVTTALQLTLQETGGNTNTWGSILNDNWDIVEDKLTGAAEFSVTTADVTLTDAQNRNAVLKTSGALTGNRAVIVRTALGIWDVYNGCSGGFDLTVKPTAGAGVIIPQGEWKRVRCDGTDVVDMAQVAALIADEAVGTDQIEDGAVTSAKLAAEVIAIPTGLRFGWLGTTGAVPSGYILLDGLTIGDATSGANYVGTTYQALFLLLWAAYGNTELAILNSNGSAGSRGASAQADFDAHKRLPLPDYRGRVAAGNDTMSSSSANRLTNVSGSLNGDTMGATGGTETHTLTAAQSGLQAHVHTGPAHTHLTFNTTDASINAPASVGETLNIEGSYGSEKSYCINGSGTSATLGPTSSSGTGNTGSNSTASGSAHPSVQPTIIENVIAKL